MDAPKSRPPLPRLPLPLSLSVHGSSNTAGTDYENSVLGRSRAPTDQLEPCASGNTDEATIESAMNCLLSERRKEQGFPVLQCNDLLSPRFGSLSSLSTARVTGSSNHGSLSKVLCERISISLPNSSRESYRKNACPLPDSLRSRFCKNSTMENSSHSSECGHHSQRKKGPLEEKLLEHGITPVFEPKSSQERLNLAMPVIPDVSDLRVFLICPGPKHGGQIQCHIKRIVNSYKMYPRYKLFLTKGDFFLLSARKRKKSKTSDYIISLDEDNISNKNGNYFGNVQSNFLGSKYWFYDKGDIPNVNKDQLCYNRPTDRVELGAVVYDVRMFGTKGPHKMTAIIPAIDSDDRPFVFDPEFKDSASILNRYYSGVDHEKMVIMKTKLPQWNQELVTEYDSDYVVLQFGKVS